MSEPLHETWRSKMAELVRDRDRYRAALENIADIRGTPVGVIDGGPYCLEGANIIAAYNIAHAALQGDPRPPTETAVPTLAEVLTRAALQRDPPAEGLAEPEGWVLVPREPTREMWAAMGDALVGYRQRHHDVVAQAVWNGVLAAALLARKAASHVWCKTPDDPWEDQPNEDQALCLVAMEAAFATLSVTVENLAVLAERQMRARREAEFKALEECLEPTRKEIPARPGRPSEGEIERAVDAALFAKVRASGRSYAAKVFEWLPRRDNKPTTRARQIMHVALCAGLASLGVVRAIAEGMERP